MNKRESEAYQKIEMKNEMMSQMYKLHSTEEIKSEMAKIEKLKKHKFLYTLKNIFGEVDFNSQALNFEINWRKENDKTQNLNLG